MVSTMPQKIRRSYTDSLQECRNHIDILVKKTESLYLECRHDQDKTAQIRGMGTALANLTYLVNELEGNSRRSDVPERSHTVNGIAYRSVRLCDLERISDK